MAPYGYAGVTPLPGNIKIIRNSSVGDTYAREEVIAGAVLDPLALYPAIVPGVL